MEAFLVYIALVALAASSFMLGTYVRKGNRVYKDIRIIDLDKCDGLVTKHHIDNYQAEGYYYSKEASYDNILVFVKED